VLGFETWQTWNLDPGREQNEPLDGNKHLADPRLAVALNKLAVVSRSGYTFPRDDGWAFTLRSSTSWIYWDFTDAGITPGLRFDQNNNTGASFRILIANLPGDEYAVSETVYDNVGWPGTTTADLASLNWLSFDPTDSSLGGSVTPDFSKIYELGFARAGAFNYTRIDNIFIQGRAVPEPSSAILMAAGLLGLLACAGRRGRRLRRHG
jgi:hypothetical protein